MTIKKRTRRRDYGSVRMTERDFELLKWIAEGYAVRVDHLKVLGGRWLSSGTQYKLEGDRLKMSAVRNLYYRWGRAGWVEWKKFFVEEPTYIWLSKDGVKDLALEYVYWTPSVGRLRHIHAVNAVRLHIEEKSGPDLQEWVCERQLDAERRARRKSRANEKRRMVDAEAIYKGHKYGVEVELTQKSWERLKAIIRDLAGQPYRGVWYFTTDECVDPVKKAIAELPKSDARKFQVYSLPERFMNE